MTELQKAIEELWTCFLSPPQHGCLTSICQTLILTDERFPNDFLEKFIYKLGLSGWKQRDDPEFKAAKKMMRDLFLRHKKNVREQRRKEERKLGFVLIPTVPTAAEIANNVAEMRRNIQRADEDYAAYKRQQSKDESLGRRMTKMASTLKIAENVTKNTGPK